MEMDTEEENVGNTEIKSPGHESDVLVTPDSTGEAAVQEPEKVAQVRCSHHEDGPKIVLIELSCPVSFLG